MLSLIDFLALILSTDSIATRLLAFWCTETAFLLIHFALLGLKVILWGLKSLGMHPPGSNKSIESNKMNVLKVIKKSESTKIKEYNLQIIKQLERFDKASKSLIFIFSFGFFLFL